MNATTTSPLLTAVVPMTAPLPPDLALLLAPVRSHDMSNPDTYVARADGMILDESGRAVAFIVRLARKLDVQGARTLVPVANVSMFPGPELRLLVTDDELRAQPRLDADLQPQDTKVAADGARPPGTPSEAGVNANEAVVEGVGGAMGGAILGGALGALAGLAVGGPIGVAAMAVFFATGGSFLGVISGAAKRKAPEVVELAPRDAEPNLLGASLRALEARLADPAIETAGMVSMTRFAPPVVPAAEAAEPAPEAAGWR